jgi:hypothetical protein
MPSSRLVERYRSYAAKCVKISRNISDPIGKLVILEMAQSWLDLAQRAAEEAQTTAGVESPVAGTPAPPSDCP